MLNSYEGEEDLFFDSSDCLPLEEPIVIQGGWGYGDLEYEIWLNEPQSVEVRRQNFLCGVGLAQLPSEGDQTAGLDRITSCSAAVSSSSGLCTFEKDGNSVFCGRETHSEANFIIDEIKQDHLDDKQNVACENENSVSLCSILEYEHSNAEECTNIDDGKKKMKSWWKFFKHKKKHREGTFESRVSNLNPETPKTYRTKVKQNKKRCMEFTGVFREQEIQAHKGFIWTMKFSQDGQFLATGGEDGTVRIWHVTSVDASQKLLASEGNLGGNYEKGKSSFSKKKLSHTSVVIPEKIFNIEESPIHEFYGHASDVLDLAWSNSNCLLSSSKDKTVHLWQVGCDYCLDVFCHTNYVTCIQFNPVDENYFISGSIDGKVRIWGMSEKRVVDWVDVHDVTSAICYRPDGKGFVVGSISGNCRFYEASSDDLQLEVEIYVQGRKKTSSNRITSIQFSQEGCQRVMISSVDSKLHIFDKSDIVYKFKGLPKSGSQMSASFTSTGRHIISVGEDCRIYVWNYDGLCTPSSKHIKSVRSCEHLFVEGVSVAVPWSGMRAKFRGFASGSTQSRMRMEEGASHRRDSECFSLGNWFFMDGPCRGASATWPEEKLPHWDVAAKAEETCQHLHYEELERRHINTNDQTALSDVWGLVIVTAGWDGTIRTFHNYGLPVRL